MVNSSGSDWQIRTPFSAGFVNPAGASLGDWQIRTAFGFGNLAKTVGETAGFGNPARSKFGKLPDLTKNEIIIVNFNRWHSQGNHSRSALNPDNCLQFLGKTWLDKYGTM